MQSVDGQKRMLIHRIAMKKVAHYQRVDEFELWQKSIENAAVSHCPQAVCGIRSHEHVAQMPPERLLRLRGGQRGSDVDQAPLRLDPESHRLMREPLEDAQDIIRRW